MSEDPVKYEPIQDHSYERGYDAGWNEASKQKQIRIEALRAAAAIMAGVEAGKRSGDITINMAERFASYLESGE